MERTIKPWADDQAHLWPKHHPLWKPDPNFKVKYKGLPNDDALKTAGASSRKEPDEPSHNSQGAAPLRSTPSHGGLVLPSAALAWQNGHRSLSEDPIRRPLLVPVGSVGDCTNPAAPHATPRRPSAPTVHSRQSSSSVPTTSHSSTSSAGPSAPGTAFPRPMRQHRQEVGYYTSIHTSNVEVSSRRTTSDGRTKVKLALLGLRVERCGVCLMQFREGELGARTVCEHVFHEACLGKWLKTLSSKQASTDLEDKRTRTCPLCRRELN